MVGGGFGPRTAPVNGVGHLLEEGDLAKALFLASGVVGWSGAAPLLITF